MTEAAFYATYSDWRLIKGRKVVQIVFEVPVELANDAYKVLGGMPNPAESVWCGVARLNMEVPKAPPSVPDSSIPQTGERKPRRPLNLPAKAALLCKNPLFWRYVMERTGMPCSEESAAGWLRKQCKVDSRSEIRPDTFAGATFNDIYDEFCLWRDEPAVVE